MAPRTNATSAISADAYGPPGMNQPIPLDMPIPEAPRISVQATPTEEPSISQEEQDALLDELS